MLPGRIKFFFKNLSSKTIRELIAIGVILCISLAISLPAFFSDLKKYRNQAEEVPEDGITVSDPKEQGMDAALLKEADNYISQTSALSFIVMRGGFVVHEKYYGDNGQSTYNNVFSVTKSVISALTGIGIREGNIGSVDDRLESYLPSYVIDTADKRWSDITLKHLLTMTPGFLEDLASWTRSEDWIKATFQLPLSYRPGERFQYANSASHMVSAVLTKASGMSTFDFAEKYLFKPMGITNKKWSQDPSGYYTGYANLFLRPRDMAKFGQLYLNRGKWEGRQLVPEEWVEASTSVMYDFNKEEDRGFANGYGYKWWINGETGYYMYSAVGYGGQSINVIPDLDLVVVFTAIPDAPVPFIDEFRFEVLKKYVIPAVLNNVTVPSSKEGVTD